MSEQSSGWTEHRLLVLEMLERHEEALKLSEQRYYQSKEECRSMIVASREEIAAQVLVLLKPSEGVQLAKITSTWEFRGVMFTSVLSFITALIALLK